MSKILLLISIVFSVQSFAKVSCGGGVFFENDVTIESDSGEEITLDLNGVGIKKVLFFNLFYAAFYLENVGQKAGTIINSTEHKVGIIHALRKITKKQLASEWDKEFERLCGSESNCQRLRKHHERFLSYARDLNDGERMYLISFPDRIELEINMKETFPPIYSPSYARILQNSLFGPDAADAELKKGILGQKKICH